VRARARLPRPPPEQESPLLDEFKALREDRQRNVHERRLARSPDAAQRALAGAAERVASFRYAGIGHLTAADALLASSAAARAREHRRLRRDALAMEVKTGGAR